MPGRTIWINGDIKPESEAVVSIYDSAMMFGDTVFEMMRTYNKQTFRLDEHLDRLFASCNILDIEIPYTRKKLKHEHENLILHNEKEWTKDDEVRTLINVTRGLLPIYAPMGDVLKPTVTITAFPMRYVTKGMSKFYKCGVNAIVPSQRAIPEWLLDPKLKTRSRQHYQVANLEIKRQDPEAWALLLDPDGHIAEGTGSNFFIVSNNSFEIYTPKGKNVLRGISRKYVMDLARKLKYEVIEKDITLYDVYNAREAFFTCTPFGIMPCRSINGKPIGEGLVGRRTKYLMSKWFEEVGVDWVSQAEEWDGSN